MKKYLLGACLFLSTQVFAYTGATVDFTKLMFNQAMTASVVESFDGVDAKQQQCMGDALKPTLGRLAVVHVDKVLTKSEQKLMDNFFDTPLGKEMFKELRAGNLDDFGDGIDLEKYNEADYRQYKEVLPKYGKGDVVATLSADKELLSDMLMYTITCGLMDFSDK
ncbi:hypothetical protein [Moraxella oblonga]|uniref:hypothetical protein n=1 Tax=Moraxella oblonga TaxID=200413 RepID=UPI000829C49E|nr:hypothetical protein [Moraxella oblonga]